MGAAASVSGSNCISSREEAKKVGVKSAVVVQKIAVSALAMQKLSSLITRIIDLAKLCFQTLSAATQSIYTTFKTASGVLKAVDVFSRISDWINYAKASAEGKIKRWQQTAALSFYTVGQSLGLITFISKFAEFDFKNCLGSVGVFPIMGIIDDAVMFFGLGIYAWSEGLNKGDSTSKIERLNIKNEAVKAAQAGPLTQDKKAELTRKYEAALLKRVSKTDRKFTDKMAKFAVYITDKLNTEEKQKAEGKDLTNKVKMQNFKSDRYICSIAFAALKMFAVALGVAGLATGHALLSATGAPIVLVQLAAAGVQVYKVFYTSYNEQDLQKVKK